MRLRKKFGISLSTLFNLFAKNVIINRKLPFQISLDDENKQKRIQEALDYTTKLGNIIPQKVRDELNLSQEQIDEFCYDFRHREDKK
jgi:antitoxin component of RelBE/YafQ-DinJ toxin-antitoxin module